MALRAYIDDSGTKGSGRFLCFAGLMGPAEALAEVSDDWANALHEGRQIQYFKLDEAQDLAGQFKYWGENARDQKVDRLVKVINRSELLMLIASVDLYAHEKFAPLSGPKPNAKGFILGQPYLLALYTVMQCVAHEAKRIGAGKPEIIFDNNDRFRPIVRRQYASVLRHVPADLREHMPIEPWFMDDKEVVLLQAADLIAGARLRGE